jgi:MFS family permease
MGLGPAVLAGGVLSTLYLAGRLVGVPVAGFVSDRLMSRGIPRKSIAIVFLVLTVVLLWMMPFGIQSTRLLAVVAFLLGMSINMYPLITSAVSETFGPQKTSSAMGILNTVSQFSGATALALSGAIGIALAAVPGNALDEYEGIWLVGIAGCLLTIGAGLALSWLVQRSAVPTTVKTVGV